jgi:uncharacterized protein (TIGR02001 family)
MSSCSGVVAAAVAILMLAAPAAALAETTGNVGVFSQYVLRGITNAPEDDDATLQGGIDWAGESGFYLGYWGSTLSYRTAGAGSDGFENDFFAGYAGTAGRFNYSLGLIQYYYLNVDDSDLLEFSGSLGIGPVSLGVEYLLQDGAWGNAGDAYWTLNYGADLPAGFSFSATLGYYTYDDADPVRFGLETATISAFRHLDLSLSRAIGDSGAAMSLTYVMGGKDRAGIEQDDALVLAVTYDFGL